MSDAIAPIMFVTLLVFIFSGFPVAFAIAGTGMVFGGIGVLSGAFAPAYLVALFERTYGIVTNQVMLAVPFFIFMGTVLEKSRLAEDLLHTVGQLFGPVRGGLALAVVLVGTLLAAATGVVGASVVAMGMISLPVMLRYGYRKELVAGVICASGTLAQIIPPSVVLVVLGDQIGTSVGDLFQGALVPGLLLATLYALYIVILAFVARDAAPALPPEERNIGLVPLLLRVSFVMLPPLLLILIVLGGIFWGVATPTEAGALGSVGALGLSIASRRLTLTVLRDSLAVTTTLTSMVMFLLVGSTAFALVFRGFDGDLWVTSLFTSLPGGKVGALIVSNLVIFVLGFFIDFFEIAFIVVPLLVPVFIGKYGVDPTWFGVMIAMNLQTSFLTPPFGFALFYLKGVAPPELRTIDIYRGVVPFILIQLVALVLVIAFPGMVTWVSDGR